MGQLRTSLASSGAGEHAGRKLTVWADTPVQSGVMGGWSGESSWALADPELNGYVGSAGTVGEAWPHSCNRCDRLVAPAGREGQETGGCEQMQLAVSQPLMPYARRLLSLSRWALGHREPPPLGTGCDLGTRFRSQDAHWGRPTGSGGPAEPGHQLGTSGWAFQRSRCPTPFTLAQLSEAFDMMGFHLHTFGRKNDISFLF